MQYNLTSFEVLKMDVRLNNAIKDKENHIWKNLIKIEQLKRQKNKEKDSLLRSRIQCQKTIM
jgi:hypothetical protein